MAAKINTRSIARVVRQYQRMRRVVDGVLPEAGIALAQQVYGPVGMYSLRHVARKCGYSPTYLSRVLNGKQTISPDAYVAIADWFFRDGD